MDEVNSIDADVIAQNDQAFIEQSKPELEKMEVVRRAKLKIFNLRKKIAMPAALIIAPITGYIDYWLLFLSRGDNDGAGLTFLVMGALYWWATQPKRQYAKAYKSEFLPKIAQLFGNLTYKVDGQIAMEAMEPSKIVPNHDKYISEDYFSGEYKGIHVQFSEINLKERRRSRRRTRYVSIFKGLAVHLHIPHKKFYGHTILDRNKGSLGEWFRQKTTGLKRARMVDSEFENYFDAYTNDQVEARYLIDPLMIERLNGLYVEYKGEQMAAAFYESGMLILIASKHNHFEPADIQIPATDTESLLNMKREVGEILAIIDKLALYDPKAVEQAREAQAIAS